MTMELVARSANRQLCSIPNKAKQSVFEIAALPMLLAMKNHHSWRSASIGSSRAALSAGK